jgi:predicted phage terminase large subunit-like protein
VSLDLLDLSDLDLDGLERAAESDDEVERLARIKWESEASLMGFVRRFWHVLEPATQLVDGWALDAICEHLEAVTDGRLLRLLINVPPGSSKSILVSVMWPAWEMGPRGMSSERYLTFSYSPTLTERDLRRCRDVIGSPDYQAIWGARVAIDRRQDGGEFFATLSKGWRLASSVGGVGTGLRGSRLICDDVHNVKQSESEKVRDETIRWWREVLPTRLSDPTTGAIVVVMQRVHEGDVAGWIMGHDTRSDWCVLMIPMHYDPERHCATSIGWQDPRGLDDETGEPLAGVGERPQAWCEELRKRNGELFWPERFPAWTVDREMETMGPFAVAGQYEQAPTPRGGGLIKAEWWQLWERPRFPDMDLIVASLDGAYTKKTVNDPSAATVWGRFYLDGIKAPQFMLLWAWAKRLHIHELVERTARTCLGDWREDDELARDPRPADDLGRVLMRADILLVENKASGASVAQEIVRQHGRQKWRTLLITPKGDKTGRLLSVEPFFAAGQVWAPDKTWAQDTIDEVSSFPRGAHDDRVDSLAQALAFMRNTGAVRTTREAEDEWLRANTYRKPRRALYPAAAR